MNAQLDSMTHLGGPDEALGDLGRCFEDATQAEDVGASFHSSSVLAPSLLRYLC
jgi:hypothetical protein